MKNNSTKKLAISGLMLATALLLPFLTGQIPQVGSMLSPMHIPVLLCGFICGWPYGLIVGAAAPGLRYLIFAMPPIMPTGLAMTFELAAYGFSTGVLYRMFSKNGILVRKNVCVYICLIASMLIGRIVWGVSMYVIAQTAANVSFSLSTFFAGAFVKAVPGIILHIILIPIIVTALKKAGFVFND